MLRLRLTLQGIAILLTVALLGLAGKGIRSLQAAGPPATSPAFYRVRDFDWAHWIVTLEPLDRANAGTGTWTPRCDDVIDPADRERLLPLLVRGRVVRVETHHAGAVTYFRLTVDPVQDRRLAALVERLDSKRYADRAAAQAELLRVGRAAAQAVRDGLRHRSPEVRNRCEWLDRQIRGL